MSKHCVLISIIILLLFSCEKGYVTDCKECVPEGIGSVKLELWMGSTLYDPVYRTVTVYEGTLEEGHILNQFSTELGYIELDAMLYKNYTVTVEFASSGKKYISIGDACPGVRYDESSCDQPCYYIYNNIIDLRLRYDK